MGIVKWVPHGLEWLLVVVHDCLPGWSYRCSMCDRSGDRDGQGKNWIISLAVWGLALSCWRIYPLSLHEGDHWLQHICDVRVWRIMIKSVFWLPDHNAAAAKSRTCWTHAAAIRLPLRRYTLTLPSAWKRLNRLSLVKTRDQSRPLPVIKKNVKIQRKHSNPTLLCHSCSHFIHIITK